MYIVCLYIIILLVPAAAAAEAAAGLQDDCLYTYHAHIRIQARMHVCI